MAEEEARAFARRFAGGAASVYAATAMTTFGWWIAGSSSWPGPLALGAAIGLGAGGAGFALLWALLHVRPTAQPTAREGGQSVPLSDDQIRASAQQHLKALRRAVELLKSCAGSREGEERENAVRAAKSEYNRLVVELQSCARTVGVDLHAKSQYWDQTTDDVIRDALKRTHPYVSWREAALEAIEGTLGEWERIEADPSRLN